MKLTIQKIRRNKTKILLGTTAVLGVSLAVTRSQLNDHKLVFRAIDWALDDLDLTDKVICHINANPGKY